MEGHLVIKLEMIEFMDQIKRLIINLIHLHQKFWSLLRNSLDDLFVAFSSINLNVYKTYTSYLLWVHFVSIEYRYSQFIKHPNQYK